MKCIDKVIAYGWCYVAACDTDSLLTMDIKLGIQRYRHTLLGCPGRFIWSSYAIACPRFSRDAVSELPAVIDVKMIPTSDMQ